MPKIVGMCFEATGQSGPMQLHQSGTESYVLAYGDGSVSFDGPDIETLRELLEFVRKRQVMVKNLLSE